MSNARNLARLLPNASGQLPDAAMASGSVLQVVQASNSTEASTTSSSYVASNLSASITPSNSTSKILVIINAPLSAFQLSAAYFGMGIQINRGSTPVFTDTNAYDSLYAGAYGNYLGNWRQRTVVMYLDSPSTASSVTYTLYFTAYQGTAKVSGSGAVGNITLMEIAA